MKKLQRLGIVLGFLLTVSGSVSASELMTLKYTPAAEMTTAEMAQVQGTAYVYNGPKAQILGHALVARQLYSSKFTKNYYAAQNALNALLHRK